MTSHELLAKITALSLKGVEIRMEYDEEKDTTTVTFPTEAIQGKYRKQLKALMQEFKE